MSFLGINLLSFYAFKEAWRIQLIDDALYLVMILSVGFKGNLNPGLKLVVNIRVLRSYRF